jgi:hypothetical protein
LPKAKEWKKGAGSTGELSTLFSMNFELDNISGMFKSNEKYS